MKRRKFSYIVIVILQFLIATVAYCQEPQYPAVDIVIEPNLKYLVSQKFFHDGKVILNIYYPDGMLESHGVGTVDKQYSNTYILNKTISYDMRGNIVNKNYSRNFKYRLDPSFKPLCQRTFLVQPYIIICYVMAIDNNDFQVGLYCFKENYFVKKILIAGKIDSNNGLLSFEKNNFNLGNMAIKLIPETQLFENDKKTSITLTVQNGINTHKMPIYLILESN